MAPPTIEQVRRKHPALRGLRSQIAARTDLLFIKSSVSRFWSKVDKSGSCWIWLGAKAAHGYGQFSAGGKHIMAHRYAHLVSGGLIPKGYQVHHLCKNVACVNPDHFEVLTKADHAKRHSRPQYEYVEHEEIENLLALSRVESAYSCKKCGYQWESAGKSQRCPTCNTPFWNISCVRKEEASL